MTLTIGGFTEPRGPQNVDRSYGILEFDLLVTSSSLDEARAKRHQLLGLLGEQQPVPVTFTDDPQGWDGFYVAERVDVEDTQAWFTNNGVMRARVRLVRLTDQPAETVRFEIRQFARLRPNNDGITTGSVDPRVSIPDDPSGSVSLSTGSMDNAATVGTATGDLLVPDQPTTNWLLNQENRVVYVCRPSTFYQGAAQIEFSPDGTNWYRMHGRHMFAGGELPFGGGSHLRLSNGRVRFTRLEQFGAFLQVEWWDGSVWRFITNLHMGTYKDTVSEVTPTRPTPAAYPVVLRNTVESCAIRVMLDQGDFADIVLDRGGLHFECATNRQARLTGQAGFELLGDVASGAASSISGGIRKTTFTAFGTKWVFLSPELNNRQLTVPPAIWKSTSSSFGYSSQFAFGVTETNDGADIISDYFATLETTQRVVR